MTLQAGILAIGTEVVSGQIVNRNPSKIATLLGELKIDTRIHLAVSDNFTDIKNAFAQLEDQNDLVFVTGGLGPTSDDFTRNVVSEYIQQPLEFNQSSWEQIEDRCKQFGIELRENQRQQCYFPNGATIFKNSNGTANAFMVQVKKAEKQVPYFFLPGPPAEVDSVWKNGIRTFLEAEYANAENRSLECLQMLGIPESLIAERTEEIFANKPVELGYRYHSPYVEIKVWYSPSEKSIVDEGFSLIESEFRENFICRGENKIDSNFINAVNKLGSLKVIDTRDTRSFHRRIFEILNSSSNILTADLSFSDRQASKPENNIWIDSGHKSKDHTIFLTINENTVSLAFKSLGTTPLAQTRNDRIIIERAIHFLIGHVS